MRPTSYECTRCGMAVPIDSDRCPSCRGRSREQIFVPPSALTGPDAAVAWEHTQGHRGPVESADSPADVRATRPVGPGAAAAHTALRLVELAALAVVAISLARAALSLAVADGTELEDLGWWTVLNAIAVAGVVVAGGAVVAAVVLLTGWAAAAGHNVRALALDGRRWIRGSEQVAGRVVLVVGLLIAWGLAPDGPDRADRAIDLGLAVLAAAALVLLAGAAQRLLVSVTTIELQRAETLARIESATVERPRSRT